MRGRIVMLWKNPGRPLAGDTDKRSIMLTLSKMRALPNWFIILIFGSILVTFSISGAMLRFFHWALTEGAPVAEELKYATVPPRHVPTIERMWSSDIRVGKRVVW